MEKENLIHKYENDISILNGIERMNLSSTHPSFKVGQTIEFNGGYYNNIRFISKITGFDEDKGIYVLWDCYWFAIKDEKTRDIKLIQ